MKRVPLLVWKTQTCLLLVALSSFGQETKPNGLSSQQKISDGSDHHDYWAVEDPHEREKLPLYKIIPAAKPEELTPANGCPRSETFLTWHRSHGDNGGMRYSALAQINRQNVVNLEQAWIYHSGDRSNNLQCNPIVVRDMVIAPTPSTLRLVSGRKSDRKVVSAIIVRGD